MTQSEGGGMGQGSMATKYYHQSQQAGFIFTQMEWFTGKTTSREKGATDKSYPWRPYNRSNT